ncbi:MAG: hypothetical protein NXY59_04435 [Aigarchaeota archaeon]|nr:hypothetical protein [Candidatus Pelearchaeum maunauluense]
MQDGRDEFDSIAKEILRAEITSEELDELARRWALFKISMREKHGYEAPKDIGPLVREHRERIVRLRQKLGLKTPEE